MNEIMRTATRALLLTMSAGIFIWLLYPPWKTIVAGLLLGMAASCVNALLLRRRIDMLGHLLESKGQQRVNLGLASRIAMVLLAAMVAYRFEQHFNLVSTIIGCFYVQFLVFFIAIYRNQPGSGKG